MNVLLPPGGVVDNQTMTSVNLCCGCRVDTAIFVSMTVDRNVREISSVNKVRFILMSMCES